MNKESFLKFVEMLVALVFGLAYWRFDLHLATIALIVAMTVFVILVKALGQKLTKLQFISWLAVVILGGAAVFLKDESIIKWKPTVIYSVVGLVFLLSQFFGRKSLVERLLSEKVPAPAPMLRRINLAAAGFFLALSVLNIFVAQNFSTTIWVNFKIFGIFALNAVFLSGCLFYLRAYLHNFFPNNGKN